MSQQNVELVQQAVDAFNRRDIDAYLAYCDSDIEARLGLRGHGVQSDVPVEQTQWHVSPWHDRKALRWRVVLSEAEALEAAGLQE